MYNDKVDNKRLDLLNKTNYILEQSKSYYSDFPNERKLLLKFTEDLNADLKQWEYVLNTFEQILLLKQEYVLEKTNLEFITSLSKSLKQQRTRGKYNGSVFFEIYDKNGEKYFFLTRSKAEEYIKDNDSLFAKDPMITVKCNKNSEIESLLNIIEKNF